MATIAAWFDYDRYLTNKLIKLEAAEPDAGWTLKKLINALEDAGFVGELGAQEHFEKYGQGEDVAPNAFFNATEYYRAKAAQLYHGGDPKKVTATDVARVEVAIENAGMNAWSHYEQYGNAEMVNPSNSFDTEAYMNAKLTALNNVKDGTKWDLPKLNEAFKAAGLSALEHFLMYGGKGEGEAQGLTADGKIPPAFAVPPSKKVESDAGTGKIYSLTVGLNELTGTAGDDTFIASAVGTAATLEVIDKINGGEGTDTLKIYASGGAADFADADIKNVEIVRMVGTKAISGDEINVSGNADVEELWFENATMATATSLRMDQKLGFAGKVTGGTFSFKDASTAKDDSATLAFENATVTGLTVANIENLTFEFAGENAAGTVTAASAATLTIEGNGDATATVTGNAGLMKSVDTTGFAGDLSLTFGVTMATDFTYTGGAGNENVELIYLATANYKINLGAGDDTLTLGTDAFGADAKIDGGDGYNTLSISRAYSATDFKHFSNFDALDLTVATTQDVSLFSGLDIDLTGTGTFTLANLRADQDIALDSTGATIVLTYTGVGAAQARTVNLALDADEAPISATGVTLSQLTNADGSVTTLNIESVGTTGTNTITSVAGAKGLKTVNIEGDSDLNFATGTVAGLTVNAEGFDGDLAFTGTSSTGSLTVTGGNGDDKITGGTLADKLVGGDGNDTLVAGTGTASGSGAGWDELTGGKGIDAFNVAGITAGGITIANYKAAMVTITDFEKDETITMTGNSAAALTKYDGTEVGFDAIVMAVIKEATGSLKWFTFEGDTYIVNNCAGTTAADADDQVIKLVGEKDLSTATFDAAGTLTW